MTTPATDDALRTAEDTASTALRTAVLADLIHAAWLNLAEARYARQRLAGQVQASPAPGMAEAVADVLRAELLARR